MLFFIQMEINKNHAELTLFSEDLYVVNNLLEKLEFQHLPD